MCFTGVDYAYDLSEKPSLEFETDMAIHGKK